MEAQGAEVDHQQQPKHTLRLYPPITTAYVTDLVNATRTVGLLVVLV